MNEARRLLPGLRAAGDGIGVYLIIISAAPGIRAERRFRPSGSDKARRAALPRPRLGIGLMAKRVSESFASSLIFCLISFCGRIRPGKPTYIWETYGTDAAIDPFHNAPE